VQVDSLAILSPRSLRFMTGGKDIGAVWNVNGFSAWYEKITGKVIGRFVLIKGVYAFKLCPSSSQL